MSAETGTELNFAANAEERAEYYARQVLRIPNLEAEVAALRQALQDLYDASPTSCDSDALNQAQLAAEKVLGL